VADRYLLESGAPDGYLLEDSSGVLLLEEPFLGSGQELINQPSQPRHLRSLKAAAIAAFSLVSPVFVEPPTPATAEAGTSQQMLRQNSIQYQSLAFIPDFDVAPEIVTLDKWSTDSPIHPRLPTRQYPNLVLVDTPAAPETITLDKWSTDSPVRYLKPSPQHLNITFLRIDVAPEVITIDKWLTDSPAHYFRVPTLHDTVAFLDIFPEVIPPEPPEPPEPPPTEVEKPGLHVNVRHLRRPPGGFNTIYYIGDDDDR